MRFYPIVHTLTGKYGARFGTVAEVAKSRADGAI